jgi:hypothetical protein
MAGPTSVPNFRPADIDLGGDGVTLDDSAGHVGPNNFQNFPTITAAGPLFSSTLVEGTLKSAPNSVYTLDFYANKLPGASSFGGGQR